MNSVDKLQIINRVTQRALDQTLSRLAMMASNYLSEQKKLDYLQSVADEYRQNSLIFTREGFELARLQRQQQFTERLKGAIQEQTTRCDQLERDIMNMKNVALAQRRKIKTFDALTARQFNLQAKLMRTIEQKTNDEYASRNQSCLEST